jgi:hypothetical protein
MSQIIQWTISDNDYGEITWAISEHFSELSGKKYRLDELTAEQIEKMDDLSITAKILLSAIAGAVIQHLLDKNYPASAIFENGFLEIK